MPRVTYFVKAYDTTVNGIRAIVFCQCVLRTIDFEFTIGYPIGKSSNNGPKIRVTSLVPYKKHGVVVK